MSEPTHQFPQGQQPGGRPGGQQFPSYFDPDGPAGQGGVAGGQPGAGAGPAGQGGPSFENYQPPAEGYQSREEGYQARAEKDGMIEVDEWGDPVDPTDPDLADLPPEALSAAAGPQGPQLNGFPFPGISGTTRGGMRYSVGGCCLPIPFGCLAVMSALGLAAGTGAGLLRRRR